MAEVTIPVFARGPKTRLGGLVAKQAEVERERILRMYRRVDLSDAVPILIGVLYRVLQTLAEEATQKVQEARVKILGYYAKHQQVEFATGEAYVYGVVERIDVRVDEDLLQKRLPEKIWRRITRPTVDPAKFAAAVEEGIISKRALKALRVDCSLRVERLKPVTPEEKLKAA